MHIHFLGTGTSSGVPMIGCDCSVCSSTDEKDNRLRSSIRVSTATTTLVIDTTPDFRYQMLRSKTRELDAILYTHPHKDHIAGLDDIRAYNYFNKKAMPLYANSLTEEALRRDYYYAFSDLTYPGIPEIRIIPIDNRSFIVGDIPVQPVEVWHHHMPVLGFRMGNVTYITDANRIENDQLEYIRGSQVLIINALRKEKHISHFTLQEAVDLAQSLKIPEVYFTHISHQLGLHASINAELPEGIQLAYDGLSLTITAA
ncbi:MAG: MBL fold metallo-hydrolase [Chitinophagia bacterium]|nr:MBL fold metallo-hydrolase [Chitinophagia bacterium]